MFFARDLDTNLVRYRQRIRFYSYPPGERALHYLRALAGALGLRRSQYTDVLERTYRHSHEYSAELDGYKALVFMPTSIQDKRVIFEARNRGIRVCCWLYSWDNALKDNEFLTDADRYLVWNEETREDLCRVHGIAPERTEIVGAVQMDDLRNMDLSTVGKEPRPTVLYACCAGLPFHVEQEVELILHIRRILDDVNPECVLQIRPYPFRKEIDVYARIRKAPGIDVLDFGDVLEERIVISREDAIMRMHQIQRAWCFINLGSTIGLEAAYTDTPILQLAYTLPTTLPDHEDIRHAMKNEHLKYLVLPQCPNTIHDPAALRDALKVILAGQPGKYLPCSEILRRFTDPLKQDRYLLTLRDAIRNFSRQAREEGLCSTVSAK
jgi:hypothetical protein